MAKGNYVEKTKKIVRDMGKQHKPKMGGYSKPMKKSGRGR